METLKLAVSKAVEKYASPESVKRAADAERDGYQVFRGVEVQAGDVVSACDRVETSDPTIDALRDGCLKGDPNRMVCIRLDHLQHLLALCSA